MQGACIRDASYGHWPSLMGRWRHLNQSNSVSMWQTNVCHIELSRLNFRWKLDEGWPRQNHKSWIHPWTASYCAAWNKCGQFSRSWVGGKMPLLQTDREADQPCLHLRRAAHWRLIHYNFQDIQNHTMKCVIPLTRQYITLPHQDKFTLQVKTLTSACLRLRWQEKGCRGGGT